VPKIRHPSAEDTERYENLSEHWWRVVFVVVALVVAVFLSDEPGVALFGTIPLLLWCVGPVRSARNGVVVGLILLALLVWFTVPHWLGWSGRLVPSIDETPVLHTVLATLVYGFGSPGTRRVSGFLPLVLMLPVGLLLTGWILVQRSETVWIGDEGVLPVPAGLEVVEDQPDCGSGGCARRVRVVGDDVTAVMGEHLMAQGFEPVSRAGMCRLTGLVVTRETCVGMGNATADSVWVSWYLK
jgi:hypothetical protein